MGHPSVLGPLATAASHSLAKVLQSGLNGYMSKSIGVIIVNEVVDRQLRYHAIDRSMKPSQD